MRGMLATMQLVCIANETQTQSYNARKCKLTLRHEGCGQEKNYTPKSMPAKSTRQPGQYNAAAATVEPAPTPRYATYYLAKPAKLLIYVPTTSTETRRKPLNHATTAVVTRRRLTRIRWQTAPNVPLRSCGTRPSVTIPVIMLTHSSPFR